MHFIASSTHRILRQERLLAYCTHALAVTPALLCKLGHCFLINLSDHTACVRHLCMTRGTAHTGLQLALLMNENRVKPHVDPELFHFINACRVGPANLIQTTFLWRCICYWMRRFHCPGLPCQAYMSLLGFGIEPSMSHMSMA